MYHLVWNDSIPSFFEVHILVIISVNVVNKSTETTIKIAVTQREVCNLELLDKDHWYSTSGLY